MRIQGSWKKYLFYKLILLSAIAIIISMISMIHQQRKTVIIDKFEKDSLDVNSLLKHENQSELTHKLENFLTLANFETTSNELTQKHKHSLSNTELVNTRSLQLTRKLPTAIIIGVAKCATTALLSFIAAHPNVVGYGYKEIYYFSDSENYRKGNEWYREQMPFSNENQITIEKTPAYFSDSKSSERVFALNPNMKIIVIVCDPVVRAVSHYTHEKNFKMNHFINKALQQNISDSEIFKSFLLRNERFPQNTIRNVPIFRDGFYYDHIRSWAQYFPKNQILFINGEKFRKEPSVEIDKFQTFLNLEHLIKKDHFVYNQTRGLYCMRNPNTSKSICMGADKGRKHPEIDKVVLDELRNLYRPHNQIFFRFINEEPWWPI
jgi:[heparan sulfate]-glucosamine 3-sulfotransferase 5